jgi:hypothetical protein
MPAAVAQGVCRRDVVDAIATAFVSRPQVFRGREQGDGIASTEAMTFAEGFDFGVIEEHRTPAVTTKAVLGVECSFARLA